MVAFWAVCPIGAAEVSAEVLKKGEEIYKQQCAECHGKTGEGVPGEYDEALYGSRDIPALAKQIDRTMPEQDTELCKGDDAQAVAAYIYDAFYSPEARIRLGRGSESRVELARLSIPQYRNAVADLLGRFGNNGPDQYETGGLKGFYFPSDGMNKKVGQPKEKLDSRMEFDFGSGGPVEGIGGEQFSIVWEGSFFARETGMYEFRVVTPNGARLYVNADIREGDRNYRDDSGAKGKSALIDSWVSSGNVVREETAKVFLLGGRLYPIRLDYFKYKEKHGAVRLDWKPPHGAWEVMSGSDLAPTHSPRTFVVTTTFPADDRSLGYERGTSVSKEWHRATVAGAIEVATEVVERLDQFSRSRDKDPDRQKKLEEFCKKFAETAFRRPLTEAEKKLYVESPLKGADTPELGVKRSVMLSMSSPQFLYPDLVDSADGVASGYATATRLSFALWDSIPDEPLLAAAASGELSDRKNIESHARRMLQDPRSRHKLTGFFEHWLEMGERDLAKDGKLFPDFDERIVSDLRKSLLMFVDDVVWSEKSDYRELLRADYLMLNGRLAKLYGAGDPESREFQKVALDPARRSGVLTHPYLLSAFAYHNNTSPIHRGVFLTRNIVGRHLKPPPEAVAFKDEEFDPHLTMREKVTELTRDSACMSCHSVINPLGFSLENFDPIGRWRTEDKEKPVDTKSEYTTELGKTVELASARDVAEFASGSASAHQAFIHALFHHTSKQPVAAYGKGTMSELRKNFTSSSFNIRELLVAIAVLHAAHEGQDETVSAGSQESPEQSS